MAWLRRCFLDLRVIVALIATSWTAFWLFRWKAPLGRDNWRVIPNDYPWPLPAWWLPVFTLLLFGGLAAVSAYDRFRRAKSRREQRVSVRMCVGALWLLALVWPWAMLGPSGTFLGGRSGTFNLIAVHWSDISNEYFGTAYRIDDARQFSSEYAQKWQSPASPQIAHVATHPPGAVLFYYGARRVFEGLPFLQNIFANLTAQLTGESIADVVDQAGQLRTMAARSGASIPAETPLPASAAPAALWCCLLISLLGASAVPAVYRLAATASLRPAGIEQDEKSEQETANRSEARGLIAAALYSLVPALNLFAFTLDAVIATGAITTLMLAAESWRSGNRRWLSGAGVVMALTSFLSFGAMATGVIFVLATTLLRRNMRLAVTDLLWFVAGFIALWIVLCFAFSIQIWLVFPLAMKAHRYATLGARSHLGWAWMNLVMFAMFAGWPLICAVVAHAMSLFRGRGKSSVEQDEAPIERSLTAETSVASKLENADAALAIGIATLLAMLLLTLSGNVRGEVERLWLFLAPPLCAFAVESRAHERVPAWMFLLLLQAIHTLMLAAMVGPVARPL